MDGDYEIYVMDADGSNVVQLTYNEALDLLPTWSPDGSQIAYMSTLDGDFEIFVMNRDGSNIVQLTDNLSAFDSHPSWSPDGQNIVFAHFSDVWSLYSVGADGTEVTALEEAGDGWQPSWSGSGDQIAFSSQRDGSWNIYVVDADGRNTRNLTNHEANDLWPTWSRDGHLVAFSSSRSGSDEIFVQPLVGEASPTGRQGHPVPWAR